MGTNERFENRNNPSSSGNMNFNEAGTVYIGIKLVLIILMVV